MRTVGRTAVIAGTATAVAGGVNRRQQRRYGEQDMAQQQQMMDQQASQQAASQAAAEPDYTAELNQLAHLKTQGIITDEEFQAKKKQILGI